MSVTVSAIPFLLFYSAGVGISEVIKKYADNLNINKTSLHLNDDLIQELSEKEFETNIISFDTLVKTLREHGVTDMETDEEINTVSCKCEKFVLNFYKADEPFFYLKISYLNEAGMNELVQNIGEEYNFNAQEVSYKKIKERLEKQNLSIDSEEVFDDNTIVLTVNLE